MSSQASLIMNHNDRLFLQMMMCKKYCSSAEVWKILEACEKYNGKNSGSSQGDRATRLVQLVKKINAHIKDMHMEIKKCVSEEDGTQYFALVNISESVISRLASSFKVIELEYFKKIVEAIIENEEGVETSRTLLNLTNDMDPKLSKNDAQEVLEKLVEQFWLVNNKGTYSLSARCIIELEPYLRKVYPDDVTTCLICRQIVIRGNSCSNCNGKIHFHCSRKYFLARKMSECPEPNCKAVWNHDYISSQADDVDDEAGPSRRRKSARKS